MKLPPVDSTLPVPRSKIVRIFQNAGSPILRSTIDYLVEQGLLQGIQADPLSRAKHPRVLYAPLDVLEARRKLCVRPRSTEAERKSDRVARRAARRT